MPVNPSTELPTSTGTSAALSSAAKPFRLGYRPALNGLRGMAILMVLIEHALTYRPGCLGSLGVDIFFVLSGFLITSLLIEEWQDSRRISLLSFYIRRALRLFPALAALLAVFAI